MTRALEFLPEAERDMAALDNAKRMRVAKAIEKVRRNPYSSYGDAQGRCGYGKLLGSKMDYNLSGLFKIRLRDDGIRVAYKLEEKNGALKIVVMGIRSDADVFRQAAMRRERYGL